MSGRRSALLLTILLAAGTYGAARADEGRIPIAGPVTLSSPGHYVLTRDFCFLPSPPAGSPCFAANNGIVVAASQVTVDLNGHTISTTAAVDVILISTPAAKDDLTIRNGKLVGAGTLSGLSNNGIHSIVAGGRPIEIRLDSLDIGKMGGSGIWIEDARAAQVVGCRIHDTGNNAVFLVGDAAVFGGVVSDNVIEDVRRFGIAITAMRSGRIERNVIRNFGLEGGAWSGIYLAGSASAPSSGGNLLQDNTVTSLPGGTGSIGIWLLANSHHNVLLGNVAKKNGSAGILVWSDENRIERNLTGENGASGIEIGRPGTACGDSGNGCRNHLEGNQGQRNVLGAGSCAIKFNNGNGHTYRNNIGGDNLASGVTCIPAGNSDLGGNFSL